MKLIKHIVALAVMGAAVAAHAESNLSTAAGPTSATARLNFQVTIPRVIFLRVGTGTDIAVNTAVDTVNFAVPLASLGNGTVVAGGAAVAARVVSTGGNVSLTATGAAGGLTGPGAAVPWANISGGSNNTNLPNPAIGNGVAGAVSSLTAVSGVVNQTANWTFNYSNPTPLAAGSYTGQVTYTAGIL
jgi:hypothetical protein